MSFDQSKVEQFAGAVVTDVAATMSGVLSSIGNKLGLYKAMASEGPMTAKELAVKTDTNERYILEWLSNQVAGGYIEYHSGAAKFELPDEHVPVLADPESPVFLLPALEVAASLWLDEDKIVSAFQTGQGIPWGEHHHRLFCGSEALFRPGYKAFLVDEWICAMDGVDSELSSGAKVADVGCGHGASTILLAEKYPNSHFYGFDNHPESITIAIKNAKLAGVSANTHFQIVDSKSYKQDNFDLICFMDCLHDMGDPVGAARHAGQALKPEGKILLVEPAANDALEQNINPVSRLYYAASTAVCTPCSKSQEVGLALGAQAGQKRLSQVMVEAGLNTVKRVAETGFNIVLQISRS